MSYTGLGSLTKRKAEMQGRQEAARAVGLICSPNAHTRSGERISLVSPCPRGRVEVGRVTTASARGDTARCRCCLAPPTWSVPNFVRTDLQTWRLAIAQRATAAVAPCTSRKTQVAPTLQPQEKRNSVRTHVRTDPGCSLGSHKLA